MPALPSIVLSMYPDGLGGYRGYVPVTSTPALTSQLVSVSQGAVTVSASVSKSITGQSVTTATNSLQVQISKQQSLIGAVITSSQGSITETVTNSLQLSPRLISSGTTSPSIITTRSSSMSITGQTSISGIGTIGNSSANWLSTIGLLWSDGIEPSGSETTLFPLQAGKRIWYINANAVSNGNGTVGSPYWGLTEVSAGLASGDHVYVTGDFLDSKQAVGRDMALMITTDSKIGTTSNPTVVRSWPGHSRAKFDANYSTTVPVGIYFVVNNNDGTRGAVVLNIEFTRSMRAGDFGTGFQAWGALQLGGSDQGLALVRLISCWIHHNWAPNTSGNGDDHQSSNSGGPLLVARRTSVDIQVYNNLTHDNNRNHLGQLTDDTNCGGLNLLSEADVPAGSNIKFYNNLQYNEIYAIRHKHAGSITLECYYNYAYSCIDHFYVRATGSLSIHHNIFRDGSQSDSGFISTDSENQSIIRNIIAYNNTVVRVPLFFGTNGTYTTNDTLNCYQNIHYYRSATIESMILGGYTNTAYYTAGTTETNNNLYVNSSSTLWRDNGVTKTQSQFDTRFGIGVNIYTDPLFTNISTNDFTLQAGSPANSINGVKAGAL